MDGYGSSGDLDAELQRHEDGVKQRHATYWPKGS